MYGLTTGVGAKKTAAVAPGDVAEFNRLLVLNHRVGQGPALPDDVVRAALCRLANGLASGEPGVRPELAQALVDALDSGVRPAVRRYGSIGVADLSANADLAHGALGDFPLAAGEALALLCHNAVSTGHAALALADAAALLDALDVAGALDLEAFAANPARSTRRSPTRGRTPGSAPRSSASARCSTAATSGTTGPRGTCRTRSASAACRRSTAPRATRSGSRRRSSRWS